MPNPAPRQRVLVTGAAGAIGRVLLDGLPHDLVGLDLVPAPDGVRVPWRIGDCADPDVVDRVVDAVRPDAIVHLAGIPQESSLPEALTSHVVTTAALLEAMVRHGVGRIVYASSNHAVGRTPHAGLPDGLLTAQTRPRPDTFYGVAKVAAEGLLSLYADRHGIDVVCCRIGSFQPRPQSVRQLGSWLSHGDTVRMVQAALTAPSPGFQVIYGISANTRGWWDLEPGRLLGYVPFDNAESYADLVAIAPSDDAEAACVGGPYATPEFERSAF